MSDKLISGIDDVSGREVIPSRDILPEDKWRVPEFVPPADKGIGMFQSSGKRKPAAAPEPEAAPVEDLEEFGDFVSALSTELHSRDKSSWRLGEIAALYEIRLGARTEEERIAGKPTLNDLAREVGCSPQRLSEWRSCWVFWPESIRTDPKFAGFYWETWGEARRRAQIVLPDGPAHKQVGHALSLLNKALTLHLTSTDDFADWARAMTWYPTEAWAMYPTLSWQHYSAARKASAGYLENAYELLEAAVRLNLDIEAFRQYCAGFKPTPTTGNGKAPHSVIFECPDSTVLGDDYFGWLRDNLPAGATAGRKYRVTIEALDR